MSAADALIALIKATHQAKGRYHTQLAMCDLYDAVGLPNVRPGDAASLSVPAVSQWQDISTAPHGKKIIAGYVNKLGNWRSIMACYYEPGTLVASDDCDDESFDEDGYARPGWFEECESQENILPTEEPPTHWMPLPVAPLAASPTPKDPT